MGSLYSLDWTTGQNYWTVVFIVYYVNTIYVIILGECMALWGEPNEPSIQH